MWYCYVWKYAFSLDECRFSPVCGRIFCLFLHSHWLSGLEKKEASMFKISSNSFVILEKICNRVI